ncbi:glycosyltransferase family 2 protein [Desulfofundulus sp.]|uniref:glycosyltransferase family 2 protein n=1 Tax=Desulfofundulus sp. TaxID=2282750 RepID=UPI003C707886
MPGVPLVSIVIPCRNEGPYLQQTLRSLLMAKTGISYEVIVVNDGSTDGCCDFLGARDYGVTCLQSSGMGVSGARNFGAGAASGEILCFCDAHLIFEDYWLDKLVAPIVHEEAELVCPGIASAANPQAIGYGVTWDDKLNWQWLYREPVKVTYVPLVPGACLMVRRDVFKDLNGFEKGFHVFGYDDQEFSLKAWLFGYRAAVAPGVKIIHVFRQKSPYPVSWLDLVHNMLRMAFLHFNQKRIGKAIEASKLHRGFGETLAGLLFSDVWAIRRSYLARRCYDDDWFMDHFGINF